MRGSMSHHYDDPLLGLLVRSHHSTGFNLGNIKGRISSHNFQHKSIMSDMILALTAHLANGQGKGIVWDCWQLERRARDKELQGRWAKKVQNYHCSHPQLFLAPYLPFQNPGPVFKLQVKSRWNRYPADGQVSPTQLGNTHAQPLPDSKSHRASWTQVQILPLSTILHNP